VFEDNDEHATTDNDESLLSAEASANVSDDVSEETAGCKSKNSRPGPSKRMKAVHDKEELEVLKTLAKSISETPQTPVHNQTSLKMLDEDELFGQYVAAELRKIATPSTTYMLKHEINNAIFNANMGFLNSQQQQQQQQYMQYMQAPILRPQFYSAGTQPSYTMQQASSYAQQPQHWNSVDMTTTTDGSSCKQSSGTTGEVTVPLQTGDNMTCVAALQEAHNTFL